MLFVDLYKECVRCDHADIRIFNGHNHHSKKFVKIGCVHSSVCARLIGSTPLVDPKVYAKGED